MVVGLMLPELPRLAPVPIDFVCRKRFPGVQDIEKSVTLLRFEQDVYVIWHNHVFIEAVAFTFEKSKGAINAGMMCLFPEQAGAVTGMEQGLITLGKEPVVFGEFIRRQGVQVAVVFPFFTLLSAAI